MSKIADVVKLKTGYANFVQLKSAFQEDQENAERMAMYRPTTARLWRPVPREEVLARRALGPATVQNAHASKTMIARAA